MKTEAKHILKKGLSPKSDGMQVTKQVNRLFSLNDIKPGERATIASLTATGSMRRRLLDIGLIENTMVECLGRSPGGDPTAFLIRGAVIAIRSEDCRNITIKAGNT